MNSGIDVYRFCDGVQRLPDFTKGKIWELVAEAWVEFIHSATDTVRIGLYVVDHRYEIRPWLTDGYDDGSELVVTADIDPGDGEHRAMDTLWAAILVNPWLRVCGVKETLRQAFVSLKGRVDKGIKLQGTSKRGSKHDLSPTVYQINGIETSRKKDAQPLVRLITEDQHDLAVKLEVECQAAYAVYLKARERASNYRNMLYRSALTTKHDDFPQAEVEKIHRRAFEVAHGPIAPFSALSYNHELTVGDLPKYEAVRSRLQELLDSPEQGNIRLHTRTDGLVGSNPVVLSRGSVDMLLGQMSREPGLYGVNTHKLDEFEITSDPETYEFGHDEINNRLIALKKG